MNIYSKKYKYKNYKTLFPTHIKIIHHKKHYKKTTKYIFPNNYYTQPQHIFKKLKYLNIKIKNNLHFYPYFITYNFKSLLLTNNLPNNTQKLS